MPAIRTRPLLRLLALHAAAIAPLAQAQHADPAHNPALNSPAVDERILQMETPALSREPVRPDGRQAAAGAALREGSFLVSRRGRLAQRPEGWWFHFDADAAGRSDGPVAVQPSATLASMIRLMESRREQTTFFLSGEVFAYDGRNYILPTHFTVAAAPAVSEPSAPPVQQPTSPANESDPSAEALIGGVERYTGARREAPVATASASGATGSVVREGEFFDLRRARMLPDQNGSWRVVFDNDASGARVDPPMTLLPCRTLGRMVALAKSAPQGLSITVSGRVFLYEGRNYLLPTLFFVDYASASGEIRSAQ